jgi:hypothetical protein
MVNDLATDLIRYVEKGNSTWPAALRPECRVLGPCLYGDLVRLLRPQLMRPQHHLKDHRRRRKRMASKRGSSRSVFRSTRCCLSATRHLGATRTRETHGLCLNVLNIWARFSDVETTKARTLDVIDNSCAMYLYFSAACIACVHRMVVSSFGNHGVNLFTRKIDRPRSPSEAIGLFTVERCWSSLEPWHQLRRACVRSCPNPFQLQPNPTADKRTLHSFSAIRETEVHNGFLRVRMPICLLLENGQLLAMLSRLRHLP